MRSYLKNGMCILKRKERVNARGRFPVMQVKEDTQPSIEKGL